MDLDEWRREWFKIARMRGHRLVVDEEGQIDVFAGVSGGIHNGPQCTECGWACCMHCNHDFDAIPQCGAPTVETIERAVERLSDEERAVFRRPMAYHETAVQSLLRRGMVRNTGGPFGVFTKFGKAVSKRLGGPDGAED